MTPDDAKAALRANLQASQTHHGRWLAVDLLMFIASGVLFFVPGPNIIAYYLGFRTFGHLQSWRGARQGLGPVQWTLQPSDALAELSTLVACLTPTRARASTRLRAPGSRSTCPRSSSARPESRLAILPRIPLTLRELAERLNCRLDGDGEVDIVRIAGIEHAQPGDLTFLANSKYQAFLQSTKASAVLVVPADGTALGRALVPVLRTALPRVRAGARAAGTRRTAGARRRSHERRRAGRAAG